MPMLDAHGDACPNNLMASADADGFVLIDYGFWGPNPVGFDLAQLLVGDVQVGASERGRRTSSIEAAISEAYVEGLRAEGCDLPIDVVRRAHALQLLIFTGLSTLPFEHLDQEPTPELHQVAAERAAIARFSLDLVDATAWSLRPRSPDGSGRVRRLGRVDPALAVTLGVVVVEHRGLVEAVVAGEHPVELAAVEGAGPVARPARWPPSCRRSW